MLISKQKLKQLRTDKGWSQDVLAKTSGLALRMLRFAYGAAFIVFMIGLIALVSGSDADRTTSHLVFLWEFAVPVLFLPYLYIAVLCEGIIRPQKSNLKTVIWFYNPAFH